MMRRDGPVHVDRLREKLNALYDWAWRESRDRGESGDARLAGELGIGQPNVHFWINGSDVRRPNMVPGHRVRQISKCVFGIPLDVFSGDWKTFEDWLKTNRYTAPKLWSGISSESEIVDALFLVRKELPPDFLRDQMALLYPTDEGDSPQLKRYRIGEEVAVRLDLAGTDWARAAASRQGVGLVLLACDMERTICLCPSTRKYSPPGTLRECTGVRIPTSPDMWLRVSGPPGTQELFAIVTEEVMPGGIGSALITGVVSKDDLQRLAKILSFGECGRYAVFKRPYAAVI